MELFIETIGPFCKGVPSILRTSRFLNTEFYESAIAEMRGLKTKHDPSAPNLEYDFDFLGKADALYEFRQVGATNGFELFRKLIQELDPPRADSAFDLANEVRGLGGFLSARTSLRQSAS